MSVRGLSFHSVKGGVGKSTLATVAALQCARSKPNQRVYLVDMDLTGTSLADVLPIIAPSWPESALSRALIETPPSGFHSLDQTRERIRARNMAASEPDWSMADLYVPFLNDYLLHVPSNDGSGNDAAVDSICWRFEDGMENLRVLPSSAVPGDLRRIVPVIFDEQHGAFLEARLESLLSNLVVANNGLDFTVVIDVPPTIPGLSRSVMSLGLRLGADHKEPLALRGGVPDALRGVHVSWTLHLVTSPDPQDLLATERWLSLVLPEERARFRVVVNRHPWISAPDEQRVRLAESLGLLPTGPTHDPLASLGGFEPFIENALFVAADAKFEFFRRRLVPAVTLDFEL